MKNRKLKELAEILTLCLIPVILLTSTSCATNSASISYDRSTPSEAISNDLDTITHRDTISANSTVSITKDTESPLTKEIALPADSRRVEVKEDVLLLFSARLREWIKIRVTVIVDPAELQGLLSVGEADPNTNTIVLARYDNETLVHELLHLVSFKDGINMFDFHDELSKWYHNPSYGLVNPPQVSPPKMGETYGSYSSQLAAAEALVNPLKRYLYDNLYIFAVYGTFPEEEYAFLGSQLSQSDNYSTLIPQTLAAYYKDILSNIK